MLPVASFQPDVAQTNPGVTNICENVIVVRDGNGIAHIPQPGLTTLDSATALPASPLGGTSAVNNGGTYIAFVGTGTNIYRMSASYALDAGQSVGSGYTVPSGDWWGTARFGAYVHFCNLTDGLLKFDVDADSAFSAVSNAPAFSFIFPAFNTLIGLQADGENKVMRNSAIGNSLIWEGKGAGFRTMPDGEELMCGAELTPDFAVLFQRNAIRGMFRRDDGKLFDVRKMFSGRGAVNPRAMCHTDGTCWFLDSDGFYQLSADGQLTNIGRDKVNRWFLARLASDGLDSAEMAIDKVNNRVMVRYRSQDVTSTSIFEDLLVYDYLLGQWSTIKEDTAALLTMATPGLTTDDVDSFGLSDEILIDPDSAFWRGGEPGIGGINGDLKFATFDGTTLAAKSATQEVYNPKSIAINAIDTLDTSSSATVAIGQRDAMSETVTWSSEFPVVDGGVAKVRARGKYLQARRTSSAGWSGVFRGFGDPTQARAGGRR